MSDQVCEPGQLGGQVNLWLTNDCTRTRVSRVRENFSITPVSFASSCWRDSTCSMPFDTIAFTSEMHASPDDVRVRRFVGIVTFD
jgi:hypothetical protein